MSFIDVHSTTLLLELLRNMVDRDDLTVGSQYDFYYYIALPNIEREHGFSDIRPLRDIKDTKNFISLINGIKGFLLLTLDEFCHASHTRIAINRLLFARKKKKTA